MVETQEVKELSFMQCCEERIAKRDGVEPKKVTTEFVRQQREKYIYPDAIYNVGSQYGGYDGADLAFFTRNEWKEFDELVDDALEVVIGDEEWKKQLAMS